MVKEDGYVMQKIAGLAAAGTLLLSAAASAHHGWGSYDADKVLTLDGTVDKVQPDNPHGELMLKTEGKVWRVTLSPPARMANRGKPIGDIKPGDRVRAVGYPSRVNADEMRAERITHDGSTVELR
jgi:membrane protein implicated in regulation of membrane protease activity